MASARGQRLATMWNTSYLQDREGQARDMLGGFANDAIGAYDNAANTAGDAIRTNANSALSALGSGYGQARSDLSGGFGTARNDVQGGIDLFKPWYGSGTNANTAAANFMGLGGASGNAAASAGLSNFRDTIGYRDMVDTASDNAMRRASATGMLGSGNTLDALARIGAQLANQTSQQYFNNLQGLSGQGMQAAGQMQAGQNRLADLGTQEGAALANLSAQSGRDNAGIYTGMGSALGNIAMQRGNQVGSTYTGLGNSLANIMGRNDQTITGNVTSAGQAGDAARTANQNLTMGLIGQGLNFLGGQVLGGGLSSLAGMGGGGVGGMGGGATASPFSFGAGGYTGMGPFLG